MVYHDFHHDFTDLQQLAENYNKGEKLTVTCVPATFLNLIMPLISALKPLISSKPRERYSLQDGSSGKPNPLSEI